MSRSPSTPSRPIKHRIKRGDYVIVTTGKCKGMRGDIKRMVGADRVVVAHVNTVKKHKKPVPSLQEPGGIIEQEMPLHISNVALYNRKTQKADRVGYRFQDDGTKIRVFKSTGEPIDL